MKRLFDIAAQRHEEIMKEAQLGALMTHIGKGTTALAKNVGTVVAKKPLTSLFGAMTGAQLVGDTAAGARMAAGGKNVGTFNVGATF